MAAPGRPRDPSAGGAARHDRRGRVVLDAAPRKARRPVPRWWSGWPLLARGEKPPEPVSREPEPTPGPTEPEARAARRRVPCGSPLYFAPTGRRPRTGRRPGRGRRALGPRRPRTGCGELERAGQGRPREPQPALPPRSPLAELEARVIAACERDGSAHDRKRARRARHLRASTRRRLLEHLDAQKVTVRRGDEHVLRRRG